jgi:hypothetical protein
MQLVQQFQFLVILPANLITLTADRRLNLRLHKMYPKLARRCYRLTESIRLEFEHAVVEVACGKCWGRVEVEQCSAHM